MQVSEFHENLINSSLLMQHPDYKRNTKVITIENHASPSSPAPVPRVVGDINSPDGLSENDREATNYVRRVDEALQKRAKNMGHPELYQWVKGQELTDSPSIERAVVFHTVFMLNLTTSIGLWMALGVFWAKIILIPTLFVLAARRAGDLVWMAKYTRTGPAVLKYLGTISSSEFQEGGDHGERIVVTQAAGEVEEDA